MKKAVAVLSVLFGLVGCGGESGGDSGSSSTATKPTQNTSLPSRSGIQLTQAQLNQLKGIQYQSAKGSAFEAHQVFKK
ncbi:hypothetical protein A3K86_06575 [Photobacterium jeanii]|uniref:Lipoprotein n=1 Tax=Photobacterium jeanii TaxID=858640 RepID=A0A178KME1_9GAMM|nr:hypothetical protein [Photobacterium jeanii]OAN18548.1 hypothetical protein A3K86_06575 [Photobacterium jeanii]PST91770.1 hypothetical protein C9I91_00895 [Photobacterium jeanii]